MVSFSTGELGQKMALPYWLDVVCKTYVPCECRPDSSQEFGASVLLKQIGRVDLTRVTSQAVKYDRTRDHIKTSDSGEYLLTLVTRGTTLIEQRDKSSCLSAGDLCLLDTAQPYRLASPGPYQAIHLKIARQELDRRLPVAERVTGYRVAKDGQYARLAASMLEATTTVFNETTNVSGQLAPAMIDMITLAFDHAFNQFEGGNARYLRIVDKAKDLIAENLFDPEFEISAIPTLIGVSPRTLSRAFAEQGIAPAKWVWMRRLDAAREMIESGQKRSVSEIAMACGFNDFSHFSRVFKAQFGMTPSDMMHAA